MPVHERRQHFRIEDHIYFDYKILEPGSCYSDNAIANELLGHCGQRYLETMEYFQSLDDELAKLTPCIALKDPAMAHYLNVINAKIDHVVRNLTLGNSLQLRKVNISLGGMSFKSKEKIPEQTHLKVIIYTKPKLLPLTIDALVVYSKSINQVSHRTAVQFEHLTTHDEQQLSQHIMHAQEQLQLDS